MMSDNTMRNTLLLVTSLIFSAVSFPVHAESLKVGYGDCSGREVAIKKGVSKKASVEVEF